MNLIRFAIFLSVFSLVYFGMHWFIYLRVASGLSLGAREALALRILLAAGSLTFFAGMFYRVFPPSFYLLRPGNIWFGFIAILFAAMMVKLPADLLFPQFTKPVTAVVVALSLLAGTYSVFNASRPVRVKQLSVPAHGLTAPTFKIVQVSDLHLTRLRSVEWLDGIVEAVNAQNADLIAITGDNIDEDMTGTGKFVESLKRLKAVHGVYAIPGNHDHYAGIENMYALMRATGIHVLRNEKTEVGGITLVGVDDEDERVMADYENLLKKLVPVSGPPVVLLKHRPTDFDAAAEAGVLLQLSGHTHAGQIPPLDIIVQFVFKHPYGLYSFNGAYIHTTCGTGTWGPPMRLFSTSEITVLTLAAKR